MKVSDKRQHFEIICKTDLFDLFGPLIWLYNTPDGNSIVENLMIKLRRHGKGI